MTKFTSNANGGWQQKLQDSTYQRVALKAGVRNLDSRNDVQKIETYLAKNPKLFSRKYIDNAAAAGIQNLDSQNDIRHIDDWLGAKPTGSVPKVPTQDPAPPATTTPQQPQVDYSSIFQGYQDTINSLTASYNAAITNSSQLQQQSAQAQQDSADNVGDLQQQNESLKQANQRFLNASANDQLSALRTGTTTGGDNSSVYGSSSAGLSSGATQYQSQTSTKESSIGTDTPVENSVLSRKGPVVEQLNTGLSRQKGSNVAPSYGLASGRASNYYSTRFG